jgi:flagellar basal body-associated protein FliL
MKNKKMWIILILIVVVVILVFGYFAWGVKKAIQTENELIPQHRRDASSQVNPE